MAFAQIVGTPIWRTSEAVRMLASTSLPMAITTRSNSWTDSCRSACSSMESATTTCVNLRGQFLDNLLATVDPQHLDVLVHQLQCQRSAEAAEADHHDSTAAVAAALANDGPAFRILVSAPTLP